MKLIYIYEGALCNEENKGAKRIYRWTHKKAFHKSAWDLRDRIGNDRRW